MTLSVGVLKKKIWAEATDTITLQMSMNYRFEES